VQRHMHRLSLAIAIVLHHAHTIPLAKPLLAGASTYKTH
jgi:hypothetical protein